MVDRVFSFTKLTNVKVRTDRNLGFVLQILWSFFVKFNRVSCRKLQKFEIYFENTIYYNIEYFNILQGVT